jgi:four helix bundle protein
MTFDIGPLTTDILHLPLKCPMSRSNFEHLRVYQVSEVLADSIWRMVQNWPDFAKRTIGSQMVRAADSIGANIAEGSGRGSYADNRRFVRIARGSLYEVRHWLRRAYCRNLLTEAETELIRPLMDELSPKLNAYLRSIGTKGKPDNRDH